MKVNVTVSDTDDRSLLQRLIFPTHRLDRDGLIAAVSRDIRSLRFRLFSTGHADDRHAALESLRDRLIHDEIDPLKAVTEWRTLVPSRRPVEYALLPRFSADDGTARRLWISVVSVSRGGAS